MAVLVGPVQPLATGVMVNVTSTGALVVLVSEPLIFPEPLAGMPVAVALLSRVQLNTVPATGPVITIVVIAEPEHIACDIGAAVAVGVGFTNTVAVIDGPLQVMPPLVNVGVIVKVTVTGALVVLVNVPLISPVPDAAMPTTVALLSLTQLYTVPGTLPVNAIVVIVVLLQIVCEDGVATALGIGLTVTVAVIGVPVQVTPALVKLGVIVKVTVIGAKVVLVSVPDISPVPLAAIPVAVATLSLVQLYTVPATFPLNTIVVIAEPEQVVCEAGVATAFGIGFTIIVAVIDAPEQPFAVGVIVKVTVTGALVTLVNATAGTLPEPLAGSPVTVALLSLTQE